MGAKKARPAHGTTSHEAATAPAADADGLGETPETLAYLFEDAIITDGSGSDNDEDAILDQETAIDLTGPDPVRAMLAGKLSRMLPNLSRERRDKVFDLTVQALERLARDHAVIVREALASAIKDIACAPPSVCAQLARDIERTVAEPILNYCAALTDADLLAVISGQPKPWALSAIARRPRVSPPVTVAIYESGDMTATGIMLDNQGAEIPETTLSSIAEEARSQTEWQGKLVRRLLLPRRVALRLAEFVDQTALDYLRSRRDFDSLTSKEIIAVARRRIDWIQATEPGETPQHRAKRLAQQGKLDEAAVDDALSWNQGDFVIAALALRTNLPVPLVEKILRSHSGRAVTALAWRAGFSMRTALHLQKQLSAVPTSQLVYARAGTDFPMTPAEMTWQLEFFGVPPGR